MPYYVSGERTLEQLLIRRSEDYATLGSELIEKAAVVGLDPESKEVALADGVRVRYERLLLATGSRCTVPRIAGLESVEAHYLWTLQDAVGMKRAAERARSAVIIGGGFIGMLAAEALRKLRLRLTVVEMAGQLLPQLLDQTGGRLFLRAVAEQGVAVRLRTEVQALAPANGGVEVTLSGGETLHTDMVVVAAGVQPNLPATQPCAVRRGILIDQRLQTDRKDVFAAGDVAEVNDFLSGEPTIHAIWPTAVEQGRLAGANMAGAGMSYGGSLGMNVVGLFDLTLAQVGRFQELVTDGVELLGARGGALHRKVVVDPDGRMVGAMYVGDDNGVAEMGVIQAMIKRRASWRELSELRLPRVSYAAGLRAAIHR